MITVVQGTMVEEDGVAPGWVAFDDGVIKLVGRGTADSMGGHHISCSPDCLIFPGFIDIHTHCREDASGEEKHKETYLTAGLAALNGGVTFIADMPNNPTAPITQATYAEKAKLAAQCPVDVLLYAGVGPNTEPFSSNIPYKVFMGPSIGHLFFKDAETLRQTLRRYRGLAVSFHCEDPQLLAAHADAATHEERRPPICEYEAIKLVGKLTSDYDLTAKICHVTTTMGFDLIQQLRRADISVSAEVTPHHLYFAQSMITKERAKFLQMNPPLRSDNDRAALLEATRNNQIEYLASDHAPHTVQEKTIGVSGVPELDTYGPFVAWLIKAARIDPVVIFRMACQRPGAWIGAFTGRKIGRLLPGYEASITVLNMARTAADGRRLFTKCGWSPFDLRLLPGLVEMVYLRGEKVVDGSYIKNFEQS